MRLFFLLLVLMNVAFLGWFYSQGAFTNGGGTDREPVARTDPGVPVLVRVGEQKDDVREPPAEPEPAVAAPPVAAAKAERCVVVGPWAEREPAERALAEAGEAGVAAHIEESEREVVTGTWVVLEGRYPLGEAREILAGMEAHGLDDIAIVPSEDGHHLISLGLYRRQSTLDTRRQELIRAGYVPELRPRTGMQPSWTVHLAMEAEDLGPVDALLERLIELEPRVEWRDTDCE